MTAVRSSVLCQHMPLLLLPYRCCPVAPAASRGPQAYARPLCGCSTQLDRGISSHAAREIQVSQGPAPAFAWPGTLVMPRDARAVLDQAYLAAGVACPSCYSFSPTTSYTLVISVLMGRPLVPAYPLPLLS